MLVTGVVSFAFGYFLGKRSVELDSIFDLDDDFEDYKDEYKEENHDFDDYEFESENHDFDD